MSISLCCVVSLFLTLLVQDVWSNTSIPEVTFGPDANPDGLVSFVEPLLAREPLLVRRAKGWFVKPTECKLATISLPAVSNLYLICQQGQSLFYSLTRSSMSDPRESAIGS